VAGTAFTKITYTPTPSLANTRIAVTRPVNSQFGLYIMKADGSGLHVVPGVNPNYATWSRDGRLALVMIDPASGLSQIYVVNGDGTGLHKISTGGFDDWQPAWSPDNFHIVFSRHDASGFYQIYQMTASGGSVTQLLSAPEDDLYPTYTPDGTQILFTRANVLYKMNSNGTSPTMIFSGLSVIGQSYISPAGNQIISTVANGSQISLGESAYPTIHMTVYASDATNAYVALGWSPDGSAILYSTQSPSAMELDLVDPNGGNKRQLFAPGDYSIQQAAWEPFQVPIPYVASTGGYIIGAASSGFLFGMNGDLLTSFLSFTATTPTSATLTVDPVSQNSSNLIYRVNADAITSLKFVNGVGSLINSVLTPTGVKGAVISYNAATGTVSTVLTLSSKRAVAPVATKQGSSLVYSGSFAGVYNASGQNLSPGGATQVVLAKNGEVLSLK